MTQEATPATQAENRTSRTTGTGLLKGLLLLALLVAGAAGWLGWQQWGQWRGTMTELQQDLNRLQHLQADDRQQLGEAGKAMQRELDSLQEQVLLHGQKLATLDEGGSRLWYLHEARSLASLAQQRLLLTADLAATQKLLEASDAVLAHLDDPSVLPARRALASDMERVQASRQIDTTALLLRMGALIELVQSLALPEDNSQADGFIGTDDAEPTSWWGALLARLPLSIRRSDEPLPLPLAPAQLAQVRLSLVMGLEQAQLAILQGRPEVYRQALAQTDSLLTSWFASDDPQVVALISRLAELKRVNIQQALPKIGAGFEAIDALLRPLPKAAGQGARP